MEPSPMQPDAGVRGKSFYKGWRMVALCSVYYALLGGLYHLGLAIYFLPLIRTFEVSRAQMSLAFSIRSLEGGLEGPIAGYLTDRIGPRAIVIAGVLIMGCGFILLGLTQSFPTFLLVFLGVLTIGSGLPFHGLMATMNYWFRRRLGTAMSLATTGSAIGGFLITPVVAWVVLNHGWRSASIMSGVLLLAIGLPLALLVRVPTGDEAAAENPAQGRGPLEDGPRGQAHAPGDVAHASGSSGLSADSSEEQDFAVKEALKTRAFWQLAVAIGTRLMVKSALHVHLVPMLVSKGIGEGTAAVLVSVAALMRLPTIIGGGILADRWSRSKATSVAMLAGIAAVLYLTFGPPGLLTCIVFIAFLAVAESCDGVNWALIGEYFGRRHFATLRGIVTMVQSSMSFLGPIVPGIVYDSTQSYRIAFLAAAATYALAAMLYWTLRAPRPPRGTAQAMPAETSAAREQ